MWEWLAHPIDTGRAHEVGLAVSWHGRAMFIAWAGLAPLAILVARFLKVLPWQDWPRELDNQFWWRSHWIGQGMVFVLSILGLVLILSHQGSGAGLHGTLGYLVIGGALLQILLGLLRGTKGGPTALAPDGSPRGDHYDMTPRRRIFEAVHKSLGYLVLITAAATVLHGMWLANAPRWMWGCTVLLWLAFAALFVWLQRRGWAVDTYHAIWGPDPMHPGNRPAKDRTGGQNVRSDRGNRLRGH
ncbi:cytochrome b561 domain-containing protein [Thalassococcus sp. S3]|uniref:cytochrome b561 domain-containing protein n=1 Tax=Thalassococcus sp. S3 TaxID=2017482 RepID=UPI0020C1E8BB|nr:cytochrome b561 domain-containing protein [Thalassococcus sp. S3]